MYREQIKFYADTPKGERNKKITELADQVLTNGFHQCPYCEHKSMLINEHFGHIELEHPGKPLL